jgi:hypothetical protein
MTDDRGQRTEDQKIRRSEEEKDRKKLIADSS